MIRNRSGNGIHGGSHGTPLHAHPDPPIDPSRDELLTTREGATLLKCHISTLYRWTQSGVLQFWRRGGRRVFKKSDLLAMFSPGLSLGERFPRLTTRTELRRANKQTEKILKEAGLWNEPQPAKPQ